MRNKYILLVFYFYLYILLLIIIINSLKDLLKLEESLKEKLIVFMIPNILP